MCFDPTRVVRAAHVNHQQASTGQVLIDVTRKKLLKGKELTEQPQCPLSGQLWGGRLDPELLGSTRKPAVGQLCIHLVQISTEQQKRFAGKADKKNPLLQKITQLALTPKKQKT